MIFDPVRYGYPLIPLAFMGLMWYIFNVERVFSGAGVRQMLIFFNIGS